MFWNHSQRISTGSITRLVSISGFDQRFYGLFFSLFQPCLILRTSNLNAFSYDTALFILHQLHSKTKLYGFKEIQKGYKLCFFSKENSTILAVGPPKNPKTEYTFASEDDALAAMQLPWQQRRTARRRLCGVCLALPLFRTHSDSQYSMVVSRHVRRAHRAPRMQRTARAAARLRRGRPGPATLPHALTALLQSSRRRLVLRHHNLLRCTSRDTHCSSFRKNRHYRWNVVCFSWGLGLQAWRLRVNTR